MQPFSKSTDFELNFSLSVLKVDNSQVANHACVIIVVILVVFVLIFLCTWHHITAVRFQKGVTFELV